MRLKKPQTGSALPAVLTLVIGVSALTSAYVMRDLRESQRAQFNRFQTEALYQAFAQLEIVTYMVNTSGYDGDGANAALQQALARADDQFIDPDGWPSGVFAVEEGTGTGFYSIVSVGRYPALLPDGTEAPGTVTRQVTALMRERQSFADFNAFVATHTLGVSGGRDDTFPYADAPIGSIHSNDQVQFYFPDRHFRDPVTAVNGFDYVAGAHGPDFTDDLDNNGHPDGTNTFFHGPVNESTQAITGLTDVDPYSFASHPQIATTTDGVPMSFDETYDRLYVRFYGDEMEVRHYESGHYETEMVTHDVVVGHTEHGVEQVRVTEMVDYSYTYQEEIRVATDVEVTRTEMVDVFVPADVGGESAGGGDGESGYYIQVEQEVTVTETQMLSTNPRTYNDVVVNYQVEEYVEPARYRNQPTTTWVEDSRTTVTEELSVYRGWHLEATYHPPSDGVVYCRDDIVIDRCKVAWGHPSDVNELDGQVTVVSGDNLIVRDSIVYTEPDADGVVQTAYLNGDRHTEEYVANPDYTGDSVLGLLARDQIEYHKYMPDHSEVNATLLAVRYQISTDGIRVNWDGSVQEENGSHTFVKPSLRRLGGIISNRRPVSSFINNGNAVSRGFVFGRTVFDRRQLTNPPIGFPTLNRPRILATILKEVR